MTTINKLIVERPDTHNARMFNSRTPDNWVSVTVFDFFPSVWVPVNSRLIVRTEREPQAFDVSVSTILEWKRKAEQYDNLKNIFKEFQNPGQ